MSGLRPCRALDLGCGQGRNAVWLALQGHSVTGLDLSDVAIEQAMDLANRAGVTVDFRSVDIARNWQPDADYDLVVLSYFQLPRDTRRRAHRKAAAALAPGGRLLLVAHHRDNLEHGVGGPPMPEVLFTEEELADDFAALTITRNEKVLRPVDTDEGERMAHDVILEAVRA